MAKERRNKLMILITKASIKHSTSADYEYRMKFDILISKTMRASLKHCTTIEWG